MAGAAGLQNRAALQQQLLQRGLVTKAAYSPGYQVLRPDGHMQSRSELKCLLNVCIFLFTQKCSFLSVTSDIAVSLQL